MRKVLRYPKKKRGSHKVKVEFAGNIITITDMNFWNREARIKRLPGDKYMNLKNGKIYDIVKNETRLDDKDSILRTFARLRGYINANITDVSKVRWCTLTYAENMTDTERLYQDFRKFWLRFLYYCKKKGYSKPEYIVMMEPQARGAWHAHLLIIWSDMTAPYISNKDFREIWEQGFVKIKKLDDVDNVGAYLTAYLGDMEITEIDENFVSEDGKNIKWVITDENGEKTPKKVIKGARLNKYPAGFQMYRCSKGIKKPRTTMMESEKAKKIVSEGTKTYEYDAVKSLEGVDKPLTIHKEYYNMIRKECVVLCDKMNDSL